MLNSPSFLWKRIPPSYYKFDSGFKTLTKKGIRLDSFSFFLNFLKLHSLCVGALHIRTCFIDYHYLELNYVFGIYHTL